MNLHTKFSICFCFCCNLLALILPRGVLSAMRLAVVGVTAWLAAAAAFAPTAPVASNMRLRGA